MVVVVVVVNQWGWVYLVYWLAGRFESDCAAEATSFDHLVFDVWHVLIKTKYRLLQSVINLQSMVVSIRDALVEEGGE